MDMNTRIDLMERIPFQDLKTRWHWAGNLPLGLALELITEGRLRVQLLGYVSDGESSRPEPEWLTLLPARAFEILARSGSNIIYRLKSGCLLDDVFAMSEISDAYKRKWFKLFPIPESIWDPSPGIDHRNLGVLSEDILKVESEFTNTAPRASEGKDCERRGNNFAVQFNILEAALITLGNAIIDGSAEKYVHKSGKHNGLNCAKLAAEIDDNRHQYKLLSFPDSELEAPRGAARERIQKLLLQALKQELSGQLVGSSAKKKT